MAEDSRTGKKDQAEIVTPPNRLKEKVGGGGFDEKIIAKAEEKIRNNTVNFQPVAVELLTQLEKAIDNARTGRTKGDVAMREILAPAMQFRAQGSMFRHPLVSAIGNILVNFLETATVIDADALDIITACKTSIAAVLSDKISEEDKTEKGKELCSALLDSCERYAKARKSS